MLLQKKKKNPHIWAGPLGTERAFLGDAHGLAATFWQNECVVIVIIIIIIKYKVF